MKRTNTITNHETWHICEQCGTDYDQHLHGNSCPECGFTIAKLLSTSIYPIAIFILFILIGSSCTTSRVVAHRNHSIATKVAQTKYKVRQHRNNIAQRKLQYDGCRPYRMGDWKACINYADRPHSRWPFNFLQ